MAGLPLSERRLLKFKEVIANRQKDLTVILENVHDPHNIGAVLRTCDAVGISEVYVIVTDPQININKYKVGNNSSSSAKKWIEVHLFEDLVEALAAVRKKYDCILGTHLGADSQSLYDLNLSKSVALMFGNEHDGLSNEALELIDGNFIIPQFGMTQSLNISVACAISLYEASRQRSAAGMYHNEFTSDAYYQELLNKYIEIHEQGYINNRS